MYKSGMASTTNGELAEGTSKQSFHLPGYGGTIPSSSRNAIAASQVQRPIKIKIYLKGLICVEEKWAIWQGNEVAKSGYTAEESFVYFFFLILDYFLLCFIRVNPYKSLALFLSCFLFSFLCIRVWPRSPARKEATCACITAKTW
jgi:hypothetical protein